MRGVVVEARGLTFQYPKTAKPVFEGIDFSVERGESVAVLGASGSGKSTLLYLLGLFLRPTSGEVRLHATEVAGLDDRARSRMRAHHIGFVFQDAAFHPFWTLQENVAEGAIWAGSPFESAMADSHRLLEKFGLADLAGRHPAEVSGGQAQRAALCRALLRRPTLILADEPTGNLDPDNAELVLDGLRVAASEGAALVVVTHAARVGEACDRIVRLT